MNKIYYGIRYFSANKTGCSMGSPNKRTGRCNVACDIVKFTNKKALEDWLFAERISSPTGSGGGFRIAANKETVRNHCSGMTKAEFLEWERFEPAYDSYAEYTDMRKEY